MKMFILLMVVSSGVWAGEVWRVHKTPCVYDAEIDFYVYEEVEISHERIIHSYNYASGKDCTIMELVSVDAAIFSYVKEHDDYMATVENVRTLNFSKSYNDLLNDENWCGLELKLNKWNDLHEGNCVGEKYMKGRIHSFTKGDEMYDWIQKAKPESK